MYPHGSCYIDSWSERRVKPSSLDSAGGDAKASPMSSLDVDGRAENASVGEPEGRSNADRSSRGAYGSVTERGAGPADGIGIAG